MLFNSIDFMLFFPVVVLGYYLLPHKVRYIWVLVSSYYFYMCWNAAYGLILFGTTGVTYLGARILDKGYHFKDRGLTDKQRKIVVALVAVICLSLLGFFKYTAFFLQNLQRIFSFLHITYTVPEFSILLPVGISFYLFQSLGYVIDVYRGDIQAEKNFLLYATFISFFPQLVAGPIERADKLLTQFSERHMFDYQKVKENLLLMLWGLFMKMVVADRIAIFVDAVYNDYANYGGWLLVIATILFAFQIYCDFAGYSTIAVGAAGVMGFTLMENFKSPYCASGVRDFWSRWHISLTGWFKDYVYIPLGGNRRGKFRKNINTLIVFFLSGLWHGANWSFICWGFLNGIFIVLEDVIKEIRNKVYSVLKIKRDFVVLRLLKIIITFALVDFTWIFFRARGTKDALNIIKKMSQLNNFNVFYDNTIYFYIMEKHCYIMMLISILVLIIVDVCHNHDIHFRTIISRQNIVVRWVLYFGLIMSILILGVWGPSFNETAFIYFQF